jgi:hypothetical protein
MQLYEQTRVRAVVAIRNKAQDGLLLWHITRAWWLLTDEARLDRADLAPCRRCSESQTCKFGQDLSGVIATWATMPNSGKECVSLWLCGILRCRKLPRQKLRPTKERSRLDPPVAEAAAPAILGAE